MINNKIIKKINNKKEIFIIGRGPSSKFFFPDNSKFSIGINLDKVNSSRLNFNYKKTKLISQKKRIKVGSVYFFLHELLFYINKKVKKKLDVYLYGFDFKKNNIDDDYEKKIINKNKLQQQIDINSQIIAFENIKNSYKNLKIIRIGFDLYSDLNPHTLKNNMRKIKYPEIVAEVTTNHRGNTQVLKRIIEGCISSGVNIIKFQKRDVENFYSKKKLDSAYETPISKTFREYRSKLELNLSQLKLIKKYEKKFKLKIIFSILDFKSYLSLKKLGFKYFKIPSTISLHHNFIKQMSKENLKEIIISTGMTNENYVKKVIKIFSKVKKLYLLHAISSYPTYYQSINLKIVSEYSKFRNKFKKIIPGYSSHDMGSVGSMLAVAAGAEMIEKHVKIGDHEWMHYDDVAIDVYDELPDFVNNIKKATLIMGKKTKKIYPDEFHKYVPTKK